MHKKSFVFLGLLLLLAGISLACNRATSIAPQTMLQYQPTNTSTIAVVLTNEPTTRLRIPTSTPESPAITKIQVPTPTETEANEQTVIVEQTGSNWAPSWADPAIVSKIDAMTLDQKLPYLLWCTFSGKAPEGVHSACKVAFYLRSNIQAGETFFDEEQLLMNNQALLNKGIIPVIDDEGGQVCRWRPEECGLSANDIFQTTLSGNWDPFMEWASTRIQKFLRTGFKILPITLDTGPGIGNQRNFSNNPNQTAEAGKRYVQAGLDAGIIIITKHAPGLSNAPRDTHEGETVIACSSWGEIKNRDLVPFNAVLQIGVRLVMVNHAQYPCAYNNLDVEVPERTATLWNEESNTPASLSSVINARLRKDLIKGDQIAFVTDALGMGAVNRDPITAAVIAIASGEDAVILTPTREKRKNGEEYLKGNPNKAIAQFTRLFTTGIYISELGLTSSDPANPDPLLLLDQSLLNLKLLRLMSAGL